MKVCGVITEFNPFHNGHAYFLQEAKQQTGADYLIAVMSGNYVQRGEPALMNKYSRCEIALKAGADLVLELPLLPSTASAQYFARGSVGILHALGIVDTLFFGSETGDIASLKSMSLSKEDNVFLHSPNDILALEYLKALEYFSSNMTPVTILRKGAGYHDKSLSFDGFSSAGGLRTIIFADKKDSTIPWNILSNQVPDYALEIMKNYCETNHFLSFSNLNSLLYYRLLSLEKDGYSSFFDVYDDLSDKILSHLPNFLPWEDFCMQLKSKEIAYAHIRRSLLHILLNITKTEEAFYKEQNYVPYLRMLGFRKDASPLLSAIKNHSQKPLISKLADAQNILSVKELEILENDIAASSLYDFLSLKENKNTACIPNEYRRSILIV